MKEPYNATRWRKHVNDCGKKFEEREKRVKLLKSNTKLKPEDSKGKARKIPATSQTPTLFSMGFGRNSGGKTEKKNDPPLPKKEATIIPCPGITEADDPKVKKYLTRTAALGGGGRSLAEIAKTLFKKCFSKLKMDKNRQRVEDQQMHEWKWRNDHANMRVFSASCQHQVLDRPHPLWPLPCLECKSILQSKAFKNVI